MQRFVDVTRSFTVIWKMDCGRGPFTNLGNSVLYVQYRPLHLLVTEVLCTTALDGALNKQGVDEV